MGASAAGAPNLTCSTATLIYAFRPVRIEHDIGAILRLTNKYRASHPVPIYCSMQAVSSSVAPFLAEWLHRSMQSGTVHGSLYAAYIIPLLKKPESQTSTRQTFNFTDRPAVCQ